MKRTHLRDIFITLLILIGAFFISLVFQNVFGIDEHITTLFAFAVFLISLFTQGYVYGISAAVIGTLAINYAFTFPFFAFDFITPVNLISAVVMIIIAILTGALTTKIKLHEVIKAESEKERMRANLLRAVSHDIRTPLTNIYGSAAALSEDENGLTDAQKKKMLNGIREDSDWLVRIVENLLSITRIDSGKVKIIKTPTVLDELIDSVLLKFKKRYPAQEVKVSLPDDIVIIPMDTLLIEQVIVNLLDNVVRHAKFFTKIDMRVYCKDSVAIFEIEDDGCGISKERIAKLFDGYYGAKDEPADSQKKNAGIGLAVCATIIKAHGGEISAENVKTGGSLFRFSLDTEEYSNEQ